MHTKSCTLNGAHYISFWQNVWVNRWRVCYQRGLPPLVLNRYIPLICYDDIVAVAILTILAPTILSWGIFHKDPPGTWPHWSQLLILEKVHSIFCVLFEWLHQLMINNLNVKFNGDDWPNVKTYMLIFFCIRETKNLLLCAESKTNIYIFSVLVVRCQEQCGTNVVF